MIRFLFALTALIILAPGSNGQVYNDTLFFKSGLARPCEVVNVDQRNVAYRYTTGKGTEVFPVVSRRQLKHFVIYDSLNVLTFNSQQEERPGPDTAFFIRQADTMEIGSHLISVNPISLAILGLNIDYTYRFGKSGICSISVPFRLISPLFYEYYGAFYCGVGFKAFVLNQPKYSLTLAATPMFYALESEFSGAIPLSLGFVRYLKPRLAVDGYIGAGPALGNGLGIAVVAHFGLVYMPGARRIIKVSSQR